MSGQDWHLTALFMPTSDKPIYGVNLTDRSITEQKLGEGSVSTQKIRDKSVTAVKLADGSVTAEKIAADAITSAIAPGSITSTMLASINKQASSNINATGLSTAQDISASSVTITTTGRPVFVVLVPNDTGPTGISVSNTSGTGLATAAVQLKRDGTAIAGFYLQSSGSAANIAIQVPAGCIAYFDSPAAGAHTYLLRLNSLAAGTTVFSIQNCQLVVWQL